VLCGCGLAGRYDPISESRSCNSNGFGCRQSGRGRRSHYSITHTRGMIHPSCSANAALLSGRQHANPSPYQPFWRPAARANRAFLLNGASSRIRANTRWAPIAASKVLSPEMSRQDSHDLASTAVAIGRDSWPPAPSRCDHPSRLRRRQRLGVQTLDERPIRIENSQALSGRCASCALPPERAANLRSTGRRADHRHRDPTSADLFPNGKVLSSPLRPCGGKGQAAFPLVRYHVVGATGFEPVTSSVSAKH
jgi:hypothetical protein